jgi:predicted nucleotidyltransferase
MTAQTRKIIGQKILPIIKEYNINYAAIFGSYARGEETKTSDLDILVSFTKPVTYFDLIEIEEKIADKVKIKKIDLITKKALHPAIKKHVMKDIKVIYDSRR